LKCKGHLIGVQVVITLTPTRFSQDLPTRLKHESMAFWASYILDLIAIGVHLSFNMNSFSPFNASSHAQAKFLFVEILANILHKAHYQYVGLIV